MDFVRCARAVNEAKRIMLHKMMSSTNATQKKEESRQHKFVLLSSLNENEDMIEDDAFWGADPVKHPKKNDGYVRHYSKEDGMWMTSQIRSEPTKVKQMMV